MKQALFLCLALICQGKISTAQIDSLYRYKHNTPDFSSAVQADINTAIANDPNDTLEGGTVNTLTKYQHFMDGRISNDAPLGADRFDSYNKAAKSYLMNLNLYCNNAGGDWNCLGPFTSYYGGYEQQGRVNAIWVSPNDTNHILAGSDGGGLWESNNAGQSWHNKTDGSHIPLGVYCIAVNPKDSSNIIIALGISSQYKKSWDINLGIAYTTDAGAHWYLDTAFNTVAGDTIIPRVTKVAFMPGTQRLYALYNGKILYKASPSSAWTDATPASLGVNQYNIYDMEFSKATGKEVIITTTPLSGHSKVCYFDTSTASWITQTVTLPSPYFEQDWDGFGDGIFNFCVTSADTLYCEVRARNSGAGNVQQTVLMRTPLNTLTFQLINSNFDPTIQDFDVSPSNPHVLYAAKYLGDYYDLERSIDSGVNFSPAGTHHSDGRCIYIYGSNADPHYDVVYSGSDGGISKKRWGVDSAKSITGDSLAITEFYGFGNTEADEDLMVAGAQDNGDFTYIRDRTIPWTIDHGHDDGQTAQMKVNGVLSAFNEDHGGMYQTDIDNLANTSSAHSISNPPDATYNFDRPIYFDDENNGLTGYSHLWKTLSNTVSWNHAFAADPIDQFSKTKAIRDFYIDENDSNFVYMVYTGTMSDTTNDSLGMLYFSTNAYSHTPGPNPTWINITPGSVYYNNINTITVDPANPGRIWVGMGDVNTPYINANPSDMKRRIMYSSDSGQTWTDVSKGLNALPVNKLIYRKGSDDVIYAGTDIGVYKWNKSTQEWDCFNNGLPTSIVMDMEFNYCAGKLRIATYGRGMWETKELADDEVPGASDSIKANTTWGTDRWMNGSIVVTSGHSLTIDSGATIHMPKNGYVLVTPNATLTVNGATITNDCDNCLWKGILGYGNSYVSQTSSNQPTIILTDATIEHARRGVMNFPESLPGGDFTHAGAIIHAHNTHFLNCSIGAAITVYVNNLYGSPAQQYDAYFTDCIFEVNGNYRGHNIDYPFYAGATLAGVQGVKFGGCQFYNRDDNAQNHGKGYGIYCYDAGANIYSTCTGISIPCTSWQRTQFTGFGNGIKVDGTLTPYYTIGVDGADFDSCTIGIKADHFNGVTTTHSSFKIGDGTPLELLDGDCHQNIGIWHRYCEAFGVEDNTFNGYTYTGQPSDMQNIGVIVENSALPFAQQNPMAGDTFATTFHNEVYKDSFTSLTKACWALGPNAAGNNLDDNGLVYKCNTFVDNDSAIIVNGGLAEGIAYFQGHTNQSNGNIYSSSGGHNNYIKNTARGFWYYHHGGAEAPNSLSSVLQIGVSTASAGNSCGDHYGSLPWDNTGIAIGKTAWHGLKTRVDSLKGVYNGLIDCGNATGLHAYVDTMTSDSAIAVSNMLLSCSPYLSRYIVAHVANMDILSSSQLMHVLFANPDLLHDSELIRFLAHDIPHRLSSGDMISLNDSATNTTARTAMESQIAELSDSLGWIGNLLMASMKDSTYTDVDSIPKWLYNMHSEYADYDVVGYYYSRGQLDSAAAVLGRIPARYGYDSLLTVLTADTTGTVVASLNLARLRQVLNYQGYTIIYGILTDLAADSLSLDSLSDSQLHLLNTLASEGDAVAFKASDIASGIINRTSPWQVGCAIIRIDDGYADTHLGDKPGRDGNKGNVGYSQLTNYFSKTEKGNSKSKAGGEMLAVYPNPASDYVTFDYNVQNLNGKLSLRISDTKGVLLQRFDISSRQGQIRWETRGIVPGVYFYQLSNGEQTIKSGKVTILR